jgi:DeoR/GlpR family transcriptional regulator of sugar metabolism
MIPFLFEKKDLRIITNSLRLAIELGDSEFEVICLGGRIYERPHVLYSDDTVENAMKYRPDIMFFSVDCVTPDGCIRGGNLLYRIMLKNSTQKWFLTDHTKLTDRMDTVLCDFSALTGVIADFSFPEKTRESYREVKFLTVEE